jgi:two-component system nitrogen regulation response regulator NtrX
MSAMGRRPLVLIVEDEPVIRDVLSGALQDAGFDVATVDMAQYALEAVRSRRPDIVVLDLGMPRGTMQGMDFLVLLREQDDCKHVPVLILSGYGDIVNRDVTTRLGVRAVLGKPIADLAILVDAIREHLPPSAP